MENNALKADLHVHSSYSSRPFFWFLQKIGCAESYTDPVTLYRIAKNRGMDLVTITDHDTLAGSLEIAHLDDTFISEEITTYFPEDGCKLHVLAYNITERQHEEISRLRENVHDLTAYLNQGRIVHALAHPMFSINDRLTIEHFEQLLLLFKNFELSGARDDYLNNTLYEILHNLTQRDIDCLANKHNLRPFDSKPWEKNLIGGSDDHSSVNIASKYTEIEEASSVEEFLAGIEQHKSRVRGRAFTPKAIAHSFYSIGYQFYKSRFRLERYVSKEVLLRFADRALIPLHDKGEGFITRLCSFIWYRRPGVFEKFIPRTMQYLLLKEARNIIWTDPHMRALLPQKTPDPQEMSEVWFQFANTLSDNMLKQFANSILESFSEANLFNVFHSVGAIGSLYTMLAPYFVGYTLFTKDHKFCCQCRRHFHRDTLMTSGKEIKIAQFTDTFYKANGNATTQKMQVEFARKYQQTLTLLTCGPESDMDGVTNFSPIGTFEMPLYPEMKLYYPPLLKMLNYCYEQHFTHIYSVTPGPLGLAALAIARILKLPIYGTYHIALAQYVKQITDDSSMEELMWKYVIWYYSRMDAVYVFSHATREELVARGIDKHKIKFCPRGIDIERFHPSKRNGFFRYRFGTSAHDFILLYVGRISQEENLSVLASTFRKLIGIKKGIHLAVVGDGPYLNDMKEALKGMPVTFTGVLDGEDLAQAYASSDLFVFPSTTNTVGNVILEAQASGLPVIVTDKGEAKENLIPEVTGFVVSANNSDAFIDAVAHLSNNPDRLQEMKYNARHYMENRSLESAYLQLWESHQTSRNFND
jgi:glycosyltransferase involved in cell wall biosynthesis